jgi:SAM-dependent methyltransferase
MVHHDVCPLCSSEEISLKFRCTDHFVSDKEFSINVCSACGFVFTQDYPEESEIGWYYESDDYISHSDTSKGFSDKLYRISRTLMLRRKRKIIIKNTGKKRGTLLDIGSGTGYFANTMKNAGWNVKGIEINEKARNLSISLFGLEIIEPEKIGTLESGSFDCITLWHVLEHFHDPFKYMSDIHKLLKPGGVCLIALPNCNSYDASAYRQFWAAYDVPRHLWHFNPSTFRLFSERTGFRLIKLRTLPLDVFYISTISERYMGSKLSFIKGAVRAFPFAFLSIFHKSKSSSLIYLIRKASSEA